MAKPAQLARTAHTRQKAKPRLVTKAHLLERAEAEAAARTAARVSGRARAGKPPRSRG
jgi:hypothetical protein